MIEKLKKLKERYQVLTELLAKPEATEDLDSYKSLVREHAELETIVAAFDRYQSIQRQCEDCRAILGEHPEPDMKALAEEELTELQDRLSEQETELKSLLLPKDLSRQFLS